jgi:hypothetical protein
MDKFPPYITRVIEGGKTKAEFSDNELREWEQALASLSPEEQTFVLEAIEPEHPVAFISEQDPDDIK